MRKPSRRLGQIDDSCAVGSPQQVDHLRQLAAVSRRDTSRCVTFASTRWPAVALRDRIDPTVVVPAKGTLVFSRPNGLRPHEPRIEDIGGAIEAIRIGIAAFLRHRARIDALRAGAEPFTVATDLEPNFQDGCLASCVMAQWCRERVAGQAGDMGEVAGEVLGNISIGRALALLTGVADPTTERERVLAERLRELAIQHDADAAA